jgi:hypothetical protein
MSVALLLSAARAAASETSGPLPARINFVGELGCRTTIEFRDAVRRHAPELREAVDSEPAREFVVAVTVHDDGSTLGHVDISEPSGASVTRRLNGRSCAEVTDALAFIVAELGVAVHLDEAAGEAREQSEPPSAEAPVLLTPSASSSSPLPTEPVAASRRPRSKRSPSLSYQAGIGLDAVRGPVPNWSWAPSAYFELGWRPSGVRARASARLSLSRTTSSAVYGTIGDSHFRWSTARAEGCAPWLGTASLVATPCVTFDVGWVEAKGRRATHSKTTRTAWLSPGVTARLSYAPIRVLVLEAEAGLMAPLSRPRFFFANLQGPPETVYAVRAVGFRAGLRAGVRFP